MAVSMDKWLTVAAGLLIFCIIFNRTNADVAPGSNDAPHRRFEYKYSFKGPHLSQSDGTIPFWLHNGNAIPSADQVRITPSLRSQKGSVWTKNKAAFENWEAEITFRVTGRGRVGADGLAIWFTSDQGLEGPVFGAADSWNGLGIFFDSFDNDAKKNNPAVLIVGNNGKLVYDHQNDGSTQALGSCLRDFRNKPYPVRAKITYYKKSLTVLINNGFTPDKEDYEFCAKVDNMIIPAEGFFGISAATGGLADDHDVLSFLTFRLTEPGQQEPVPEAEIPQEEKEKYQEEFEHFQQDLDKKKHEFQKEHPDIHGQPSEDNYESVNDREVRQIFEGQSRIHLEIKQLNRQLDMILDEQRRYVTVVTDEITKRGALTPGQPGQVPTEELDSLVKAQQEVLRNVNDMRNTLTESLRQMGNVHNQGNAAGTYETVQHFNDIKEHLHVVKKDIDHLIQRNRGPNEKATCPELPPFPSCLSTTHFFMFVAVQTVLFIGYIMYRSQQEAAAKKFF
ncbi:protein ERGIC-53-like [Huso huso]|uniref:Protein ERGIC-53-like n=1 Tax=Huso huso TaxID=61971 RepID=A0ABR1ABX4_HUSHU